MDQKRAIISVIIVVVLVLALIGGTIFYLSRAFGGSKNDNATGRVVTSANNTPIPSNSPTTSLPQTSGSASVPSKVKVYTGKGFSVQYPKGWGLLTCNNSQNFELDPYNSADQLGVTCNVALKPITVMVSNNQCSGTPNETLGNIQVIKGVQRTDTGVDYEWCTKTAVPLDITHRVSSDGSRATSIGDFSAQVEQIIQSYASGGS